MNKYIFLAVLILVVSLFVHFSGGEKPQPSKPVLRIGAECDYVPNSWTEKHPSTFNHPIANYDESYADGYDIQIAKLVADKLNYTLEVKKLQWNDLLPALNDGEIDAVFSSMLDTDERKRVASFSNPYEVEKTEYAVLVERVSPYITAKCLKDFGGARIIGERGTKLDEVIDQIPGVVHLKPTDTLQGMIDSVLMKKADGAVIETDTGHFYEITNTNLMLVKFSADNGFKLGFNGVCAAVRKKDTELVKSINKALSDIKYNERRKIMDAVNSRVSKILQ